MSMQPLRPWSGFLGEEHQRLTGPPQAGPPQPFKGLRSRRQFLQTAAGAAGVILGSRLWMPGMARADNPGNVLPMPIPFGRVLFGYGPFHVNFPGPVDSAGPFCGKPGPFEPSLITDFNGFIGVAAGAGTSTDGSGLTFTCDMRFLQGVYVGVDGENHQGAFAFI
jgi:hypothetical protein